MRDSSPFSGPYVIAGWHVDPATLRISKQDKVEKLEPKVMAVLEYLAARQGEVVNRQKLEQEIWAGTVVGYDAISNTIIKLRKAFGDSANHSEIIETIPKTGYRLIALVEAMPESETQVLAPDVLVEPVEAEQSVVIDVKADTSEKSSRWKLVITITAPLLVVVALVSLWIKPGTSLVEPASIERMAFSLPDKPSIAVLPFNNLSDDPQQEFFADGMTEDLITDISKVSELFVIARHSVFFYKGKEVPIRQVAEKLGVRYVMTGSVERSGNQVRINAQLTDAITGGNVWAERYDGNLDDVFVMRDKIAKNIVSQLKVTLTSQEQGSSAQSETDNLEAYEAFLRGWERYRLGTPEDLAKAIPHFEKALELDPGYTRANSALASTLWNILSNGWARRLNLNTSETITQIRQNLARAMERPTALTFQVASERAINLYRKPDRALAEAERAIALDANDPAGHFAKAAALIKADRAAEAVESVRTAMRLDPLYPAIYLTLLGQAQFAMGLYEDAAENFEQAVERNRDNDWTFVYLAATYGLLGREDAATKALQSANQLRAKSGWGEITTLSASIAKYDGGGFRYYFKWYGDRKPLREGLRKAGAKSGIEWKGLVSYGESGARIKGATTIDTGTAKNLHDRGVPFVDVHNFWHEQRIPGARYLDKWELVFNEVTLAEIVDRNQEIVIYSSISGVSGGKSWGSDAAAMAVTWGFRKVFHYPNGLSAWKAAGYPVDAEKK